jgi:hypothetical protein
MLDAMHEDAFILWDTSRDQKATLWGGVMTATAKGKGLKAACIDGGIRDTHQILEAEFPVFYEYRISNGSLGRCLITHYQVPIKIGDVTIKPGDIVLEILMVYWLFRATLPMTFYYVPKRLKKTKRRSLVGSRKDSLHKRLRKKVATFELVIARNEAIRC